MAKLTHMKKGIKDIHDYELTLEHDDRLKILVGGEYVTYVLCHDGKLQYLDAEEISIVS